MPWVSSFHNNNGIIKHWDYNNGVLQVINAPPNNNNAILRHVGQTKNFKSNTTYQFVTKLNYRDYDDYDFSLTAFNNNETIKYISSKNLFPNVNYNNIKLYFYTNPVTNVNTAIYAVYSANSNFGPIPYNNPNVDVGISNLKIYELSWMINGFSWCKTSTPTIGTDGLVDVNNDALGWYYDADDNSFVWFDRSNSSNHNPAGGGFNNKKGDPIYRKNNFICRYIDVAYFNLSFKCKRLMGVNNDYISIYLSPTLWSFDDLPNIITQDSMLVATISLNANTSYDYEFYGLNGYRYLYFVGPKTADVGGVIYKISDIKISGGYHDFNNTIVQLNSNYEPIGINNATYTFNFGYGNNIDNNITYYEINSYIGNGKFKCGIWENGVWNSGWRDDETEEIFYDINGYFNYNRDKTWRFEITGPTSSVAKFNIGDNVSIGNIVAIDINEERKFIKNYFKIIDKTNNSLIVELNYNFPLRRIEVDSKMHRIKLSKNIWLSGVFLNGRFNGIWNNGLFKGYPKITEMHNTHWIDGIFDGGHFKCELYKFTISNIFEFKNEDYNIDTPKLGIEIYELINVLKPNDILYIEPLDLYAKILSIDYDSKKIVTNIEYNEDVDYDNIIGGVIISNISTGLIQNFIFDSNNISKITSVDSMDSTLVHSYNSWIDVNYYTHSAVNIGKTILKYDEHSKRSYSENNLYGYITYDVLSSISKFRDSHTLNSRTYKLGCKYKIYNDFIGDSSKFNDPLGYGDQTNDQWPSILVNDELFEAAGWTYSKYVNDNISYKIYKTVDNGVHPLVGKELRIDAIGDGGVLDIIQISGINNRSINNIEKMRYSMIEFDLIAFSASDVYYTSKEIQNNSIIFRKSPVLHFNNLNFTTRNVTIGQTTFTVEMAATYLPIFENINHFNTNIFGDKIKKIEFFYNKINLSMILTGCGLYGADKSIIIIDNLKFYETDMIPFFKYFDENNINNSIQIPYFGISPFIDYTNSNFSFINNVTIGYIGSTKIHKVTNPVIGVGPGVNSSNNPNTQQYNIFTQNIPYLYVSTNKTK